MIVSLRVRNLAIVGEAEVGFGPGLNIVSGETGAGKSILLEAIHLLLGGRASADWVRHGESEAWVEGLFDLSGAQHAVDLLDRLGYSVQDPSEFLVKRLISREGRHRVYLNGQLATLSILQEIAGELVELCSQHENQRLGQSPYRVELVDRFAGLTARVRAFEAKVDVFHKTRDQLSLLDKRVQEHLSRRDWVEHQIAEIAAAKIESEEEDRLRTAKRLLQSRAERQDLVRLARAPAVLEQVAEMRRKVRQYVDLDPEEKDLLELADAAHSALDELDRRLERTSERLFALESDGTTLESIADRLAQLADLKRKHGRDLAGVVARQVELEQELKSGEDLVQQRKDLESRLLQQRPELDSEFKALTRDRMLGARKLSQKVSQEIRSLGMPSASVEFRISSQQDLYRHLCVLEVLTNPGEPPRPIERVASGGELSRFLLAVRTMVSEAAGTGVYVFDEIDVGIGGQTAFQVGMRLQQISRSSQVICVTHLPQVASFADHHVRVVKMEKKGQTEVQIEELDALRRREELARMLGGAGLSQASLKNADELMRAARRVGSQ